MGVESVLRSIAIALAPTPADAVSRGDIVSVHVALSPETRGLVERGAPGEDEAGRDLHQHRARRGGRPGGAGGGGQGARPARRPRRLRGRAGERDGAVQRRRSSRCPASSARTTSAPRPTRRRRRSPRRPSASSAATRRPGACRTSSTSRAARRRRTCSSSATAIAPASSRTSSTTCAQANLNVQETENIVFEGARGGRRAHQPRRRAAVSAVLRRSRARTPTSSISQLVTL